MIRLLHTVRYLRPVQIVDRLRRRLSRPAPDLRPAPTKRSWDGTWQPPSSRPARLLDADTFRCLNQTHSIAAPDAWLQASENRLWLFNLHYFDDLRAEADAERAAWQRRLIERWVAENRPAAGPGWEPYPTSLRVVNWIGWSLDGHELPADAVASLAVQVRYLAGRMEFHLLGNHLWANAKALVFAGAFFEGDEAERWLAEGLSLVDEQLAEQVLPDGGHFELSPMYHAIVLEDLLDLCNLAGAYPQLAALAERNDCWSAAALHMRQWLKAMSHPDGQISLFNDAALGVAAAPGELENYARRLGHAAAPEPAGGITRLAESGYLRLEHGPAVLLVDTARVGPDYQPGHAHADTLTFEFSLDGERVIVNSGTSCYGDTPQRQFERLDRGSNCVVVDGENSSEVWHSHRVARRARPMDLTIEAADPDTASTLNVACSHNGYRRLSGRVTHRRQWRLGANRLAIHDALSGRYGTAELYLHFHPDVRLEAAESPSPGKSRWRLIRGGQPLGSLTVSGAEARVEPGEYHPRFGESLPNKRLVARLAGAEAELCLEW